MFDLLLRKKVKISITLMTFWSSTLYLLQVSPQYLIYFPYYSTPLFYLSQVKGHRTVHPRQISLQQHSSPLLRVAAASCNKIGSSYKFYLLRYLSREQTWLVDYRRKHPGTSGTPGSQRDTPVSNNTKAPER